MKAQVLQDLQACRDNKRPCAIVTELSAGLSSLVCDHDLVGDLLLSPEQMDLVRSRVVAGRSGLSDDGRLFVRVYLPPARMILVGAVHIARALAPMAELAGFEVTVLDPREGFVRSIGTAPMSVMVSWPDEGLRSLKLDARTAVVTLTHDPKLDDPALSEALSSDAFYVGALGSRKTHAKRVERLKGAGFSDQQIARIHGPVGLDINALLPQEIAVSILAQVVGVMRAGTP